MRPRDVQSNPYEPLSRDERRRFTAAMLHRAAETSDPVERRTILDDVMLANVAVARSIASRYRSAGLPSAGLEQVARATLVRAVHVYDVRFATDFIAFAVPSIRGRLRRHVRDGGQLAGAPRRAVSSPVVRRLSARERALLPMGFFDDRTEREIPDQRVLSIPVEDQTTGSFTVRLTSTDVPPVQ